MVSNTGMLGEGLKLHELCTHWDLLLTNPEDGIHVDMNHLKTGEVKYVPSMSAATLEIIADPFFSA